MYLSCLTTSRSVTDKLAFDVGLQKDAAGEACWWTMHPASKQRSEGEKVRVGDDLILVSVSSERYLHLSTASGELQVDASFMQTLWNMNPICSGSEEGFVTGGHVLRLFHGHMDECLTPTAPEQGEERSVVNYEGGAVCGHARSLWRLEPLRISWSGSHLRWGQPFRLRHVTTGRYLALTEASGLAMVEASAANTRVATFCFRASKVGLSPGCPQPVPIPVPNLLLVPLPIPVLIPVPTVTVATFCFRASKVGLSPGCPQTVPIPVPNLLLVPVPSPVPIPVPTVSVATFCFQASKVGLSPGCLQEPPGRSGGCHGDIPVGLGVSLGWSWWSDPPPRSLDSLQGRPRGSPPPPLPIAGVILSLQDLIGYLEPPPPELRHEQRQGRLRALRARQSLFQQEGMLTLVPVWGSQEAGGASGSLDSLQGRPRGSPPPPLPIAGVILSLQDLIGYLEPPPPELRHEQRQGRLRALRARQSLFQQE
ncbi:ryanodine receptor 1-like, partial [Passer montanus]|uniref:ryanodine receptor 1-like n=1 Tax=Passer montanus TaxID=9160 RepID=UPI001961A28A